MPGVGVGIFAIFDFIKGIKNYTNGMDLSSINSDRRFELEKRLFEKAGKYFFASLPKSDSERFKSLDSVQEKIQCLGWESITESINFAAL